VQINTKVIMKGKRAPMRSSGEKLAEEKENANHSLSQETSREFQG
jgi:hypothetical protein